MTTTRWPLVRLEEVVAEALPGFAVGERDPHGVVQLRMNNVDTQGHLNWSDYVRVPATSGMISKYRLLSGDVVFNNTNSTALVGKSARFAGYAEPVVYSNHFTRLRPVPDRLDSAYLAAWLLRLWQQHTFEDLCNRWIGQSAVNREKLLALEIPLPSVSVQRRIVAKLDEQMSALDRAKQALAEQQRAACLLTAAVLQHVFSGPKSSSWLSARLVTVGTFDAGGTPAKDQQSYWADTGYPFVTGADITSTTVGARNARAHLTQAGLDSGKTAVCPAGTVLVVTRTRVGRIGVAGETVAASQDITAFTCHHNLLPAYVMWYLRKESGHLIAQSRGATIQGLRRSVLENLNIPVPPVPEQKQLIETVEQATHNAALLQEDITHRLATVASMRTALLDAAFFGEI